MVTSPLGATRTECRRERSAVRLSGASTAGSDRPTSGRSPAQAPSTSWRPIGRVTQALRAPEEVVDVGGGALGVLERAVVVGVGRPDVDPVAPGDDEHRPPVAGDGQHGGDVEGRPPGRQGDVHALGRADGPGVDTLVEGPELVGPHPGGVDHHAGPDLDRPAGEPVGEDGAADPPAGPHQPGGLHPVDGHRPQRGGGLGHRQREAGVVDPGVVIQETGGEAAPVEVRHELERLPLRQALVQLADPGPAGGVVHPQGGPDPPGVGPGPGLPGHSRRVRLALRTLRGLGEHRDEEGEGLDEVGGQAQEALPFGQRLVDQAELLLLEVAEPAVDELRRPRRRTGGEVAPLDERRPQAPPGGVEGHPGAGDAAPDDEHVEGLRAQSLEVQLPLPGVEVHRWRMLVTGG